MVLSDEDGENGREYDTEQLAAHETEGFLPVTSSGAKLEVARDENEINRKLGLAKRLEVDIHYRRRFIHTMWLFWAFIGLGLMAGQTGPSFPDLRFILQKDLETAAWYFTVGSLGYLLGSLFGGLLYDHFNRLLLIVFSILIMAVTTAAIPWCASFPLMLAMSLIRGLGAGGLDTGGNTDLVSIWDEEGRPFMQALHFCFGFGGILSPLVTKPFLAEKTCEKETENSTYDNTLTSVSSVFSTALNTTNNTDDRPCQEKFERTYVHFAYLITSLLVLSSAVPFVVMYVNTLLSKATPMARVEKGQTSRPRTLPGRLKAAFLVMLPGLMMLYCAVEDTFSGFLMTFCLQHLHWTKEQGSYATSLHWAAFSVGRFAGIFLIRKSSPVQLLTSFLISLCCSFVGFFIASVTLTDWLVWVFVPLAGFSMSVVFPCIFTWTEESILEVTGKISSLFLIFASAGLLLSPLLLGYLMDNLSPIAFSYLLLVESLFVLIMFLIILFLVKKFVKPRVDTDIKAETEMVSLKSTKS